MNEDLMPNRENGSSLWWLEQLEFMFEGPGEVNYREKEIQKSCDMCVFWFVLAKHLQGFLGALVRVGRTSYCNKDPSDFNN